MFLGRDAAKRTQVFRPHMTVNQRQLPPGPFAVLGAAESTEVTPAESSRPDAAATPEPTAPDRNPERSRIEGCTETPRYDPEHRHQRKRQQNGNRGPNGNRGTAANTPERSEDPASGQ